MFVLLSVEAMLAGKVACLAGGGVDTLNVRNTMRTEARAFICTFMCLCTDRTEAQVNRNVSKQSALSCTGTQQ